MYLRFPRFFYVRLVISLAPPLLLLVSFSFSVFVRPTMRQIPENDSPRGLFQFAETHRVPQLVKETPGSGDPPGVRLDVVRTLRFQPNGKKEKEELKTM